MDRLEEMEKRLQYLEGKEADREAEKQKWMNEGMANSNETASRLADSAVTTARLSVSL